MSNVMAFGHMSGSRSQNRNNISMSGTLACWCVTLTLRDVFRWQVRYCKTYNKRRVSNKRRPGSCSVRVPAIH